MDQELRTFLQEQFQEIRQRFEKIDGRFEKIDGRFEQVDNRFEAADGKMDGLREEVHHTRILMEDMQGNVRLLAEGITSVTDRMGRLEKEVKQKLQELWDMVVNPVRNLHERVAHLEEVENRRTRDIVEVIRERFGKRQDS